MLYIHRFSTAFCFCFPFCFRFCFVQYQNWLAREKDVAPPHPLKSFCSYFLCVSVNSVRISLCFWRKSNIPWKARRTEGLCLQWGNRFSQIVCFILLRLTSLWALYTLKRTLVTLVLMGHYLTYESLRHNQLYFTFKDHLSDGPLSFLPAPSPHLPRLAENGGWGVGGGGGCRAEP